MVLTIFFFENFITDMQGKMITSDETIIGFVGLSCSRCYSLSGKKQPFNYSLPIYISVMLVSNSCTLSCYCVAVEPMLKKLFDQSKVSNLNPHVDGIRLRFKSNSIELYKWLKVSPKIFDYAPRYIYVGNGTNFIAYGEKLEHLAYPYIIFGNNDLQNPKMFNNIISGDVPVSHEEKSISLYLVSAHDTKIMFGQFTYKNPTFLMKFDPTKNSLSLDEKYNVVKDDGKSITFLNEF